ncbi:Hsp20/alpha crystallin family protein [Bacillus sp. JJ634]
MFPFSSLFSSSKNQNGFLKNLQQNDVQSFIEKVFTEVMPNNMQDVMNQGAVKAKESGTRTAENPLQANVLETHSFIYIRIPIQDESWLKQMKIYHTSNQSMIHDIPNEGDKHNIPLPALVRKKGTSVQYKDNILEIRFQKHSDLNYSEIDISEL